MTTVPSTSLTVATNSRKSTKIHREIILANVQEKDTRPRAHVICVAVKSQCIPSHKSSPRCNRFTSEAALSPLHSDQETSDVLNEDCSSEESVALSCIRAFQAAEIPSSSPFLWEANHVPVPMPSLPMLPMLPMLSMLPTLPTSSPQRSKPAVTVNLVLPATPSKKILPGTPYSALKKCTTRRIVGDHLDSESLLFSSL